MNGVIYKNWWRLKILSCTIFYLLEELQIKTIAENFVALLLFNFVSVFFPLYSQKLIWGLPLT